MFRKRITSFLALLVISVWAEAAVAVPITITLDVTFSSHLIMGLNSTNSGYAVLGTDLSDVPASFSTTISFDPGVTSTFQNDTTQNGAPIRFRTTTFGPPIFGDSPFTDTLRPNGGSESSFLRTTQWFEEFSSSSNTNLGIARNSSKNTSSGTTYSDSRYSFVFGVLRPESLNSIDDVAFFSTSDLLDLLEYHYEEGSLFSTVELGLSNEVDSSSGEWLAANGSQYLGASRITGLSFLNQVPIPATLTLFGLGLAGLGFARLNG